MTLRRLPLALFALPLALGLAACGEDAATADGAPRGEPIAAIAAPAGQSWVDTAAVTPEGGVRIGNPEAPLKLVEYGSHTCHVCADFSKQGAVALDGYVEERRDQLRNPQPRPRPGRPRRSRCWRAAAARARSTRSPTRCGRQLRRADGDRARQRRRAPAGRPALRRRSASRRSRRRPGLLDFFAERGISRDQAMQCLANTAAGRAACHRLRRAGEGVQHHRHADASSSTATGWRPTSWEALEPLLQQAGAR